MARYASTLPIASPDSLREQVERIKKLDEDMLTIEKRLKLQLKQDPQMQRIAKIPGVGLLTATAAIATMGDASAFKSGRVLCMVGAGADANRNGWQSATGQHIKTRRHLPAHLAGSRC